MLRLLMAKNPKGKFNSKNRFAPKSKDVIQEEQ
jgi:hypothetical protein